MWSGLRPEHLACCRCSFSSMARWNCITAELRSGPSLILCSSTHVMSQNRLNYGSLGCLLRRGMLIKGGRVLDALAKCRTVAFDKTGTLTTGDLMCTSMTSLDSFSEVSAAGPSASAGLPCRTVMLM